MYFNYIIGLIIFNMYIRLPRKRMYISKTVLKLIIAISFHKKEDVFQRQNVVPGYFIPKYKYHRRVFRAVVQTPLAMYPSCIRAPAFELQLCPQLHVPANVLAERQQRMAGYVCSSHPHGKLRLRSHLPILAWPDPHFAGIEGVNQKICLIF